jgi:hypothetical protein
MGEKNIFTKEIKEEKTNLTRYSPDGVSFGRVVVSWAAL